MKTPSSEIIGWKQETQLNKFKETTTKNSNENEQNKTKTIKQNQKQIRKNRS